MTWKTSKAPPYEPVLIRIKDADPEDNVQVGRLFPDRGVFVISVPEDGTLMDAHIISVDRVTEWREVPK